MWNEEVETRVISSNNNFIDVECYDPTRGSEMRITFLYAPTNYGERLILWHQLREIQAQNTLPWIYMGDFNEILYAWEKVGKRAADYYRMAVFQDLLNDYSLMDIDSKGCAYTWANNREREELVKKNIRLRSMYHGMASDLPRCRGSGFTNYWLRSQSTPYGASP